MHGLIITFLIGEEKGGEKRVDRSIFSNYSCLFYYLLGRPASVTFHFINTKDESLFSGKFLTYPFVNIIAYCQVAISVYLFWPVFFFFSSSFLVFHKIAAA